MIKLNFIIICDNADDSSGKLNIQGVFDSIYADKFPALHPQLVIIVNMDIPPGKHKQYYKISKEGVDVFTSPNFAFESKLPRHQLINRLQKLQLPGTGKYEVKIYIDGKQVGSNYFLAKETKKHHYA